ncbi:5'-AMP-activated protein kinase subunit [Komagataella phaffii CBS 7435]|uniref:5'-AMP-activated protein kinase subunit gamma n=3 Tax=Komagataella TaxID=460517 RepID=C4R171_KOMPG|nr:Activating gamma subunit of the AMP-activated Snf1p kinase complex [Komagataella phaffii GS115]ANZ75728.1 BA75_02554T0 [Komagataella pastoris]AOA63113.1 GQ67_00666T0 [Komagataella phaffii]KAI0461935.1 AMP-activated serine/threonine-protein kinase regulatory subunit [Komagataella kurtzmanii]CAH2448228.1 5'-AMP-activated protein kinase subunit [Komagataella phaffii CBS 7435]AOA67813.1 GQ68_00722T0 [Komagataella phaffii GS115]
MFEQPQVELSSEQINQEQKRALDAIRVFLQSKTSYDVLPVSYRLIVFDTSLLVKKSLNILLQNSIVSAPLWNNKTSRFAGLLTSSDFINVIQYYFQFPDKFDLVEKLTLDGLREVEKSIGVSTIETISIHPFKSLYEACEKMLVSKARRIPLIDEDENTHREIVVSVLTQYRILKFVALNCKETRMLLKPLKELQVGTMAEMSTVTMETPVIDVIHLLSNKCVSSVPIVDGEGKLVNVYEAVDVLGLIKGGMYTDLSLSVGEALMRRAEDFEGVYTCTLNDSLATIMETLRKSRIHRLFIVDTDTSLLGVITLSDILSYLLFSQ